MSTPEIKKGYVNGSDMLLYVKGKAIGHCSTHTMDCTSETKEHAVKPVASAGMSSGKWKGKSVTGLSISLKADALVFYDETECGYAELFELWAKGEPVECKCMERASSDKPYIVGDFIIASLSRTDPAQDDSTYSISLDNDGEPSVLDKSAITVNAAA